ncbi:MAG TPA: hypothetical protein VG963_00170 [Polyangiaceae bacterium]|nr:hypothetical protein [Polyangiaceae bacterium]
MRPAAFTSGQVLMAFCLACLVEGGVVTAVVLGRSGAAVVPRREPRPMQMAIAVQPVIDPKFVLKKGTQHKAPQLPEMWKAPPPPVKRAEPKALPSTEAKKTPPPAPLPKLQKEDDTPPPDPKAPKSTEEPPRHELPKIMRPDDEEGSEDGVEGGKEKDPLKARATDTYRMKLQRWFQQGFEEPLAELGCDTLVHLSSDVTAKVGPDHSVISYKAEPSGNPIFDERVRRAMDARIGATAPPPPPNYPELLGSVVSLKFSGDFDKCK